MAYSEIWHLTPHFTQLAWHEILIFKKTSPHAQVTAALTGRDVFLEIKTTSEASCFYFHKNIRASRLGVAAEEILGDFGGGLRALFDFDET